MRRPSYPGQGLIYDYRALEPGMEDEVCFDCRKKLGVRVLVVCRGIYPDGTYALFGLCAKCARHEVEEIHTGRTRHGLLVRLLHSLRKQ